MNARNILLNNSAWPLPVLFSVECTLYTSSHNHQKQTENAQFVVWVMFNIFRFFLSIFYNIEGYEEGIVAIFVANFSADVQCRLIVNEFLLNLTLSCYSAIFNP